MRRGDFPMNGARFAGLPSSVSTLRSGSVEPNGRSMAYCARATAGAALMDEASL